MACLYGREISRQDILRVAGNVSQIAGIKAYEYKSGRQSGVSAFDVKTGSGLEFTVVADKCMDIFEAKYKGINLNYVSKNGLVAPQYYNSADTEFFNLMSGGMLTTCGISNTGPGNFDIDCRWYPMHGRIWSTPAENVSSECRWDAEEFLIGLSGTMTESELYGQNLKIHRMIKTKMGDKCIEINDIVENLSPADREIMNLYHFNFGFPLIDVGSRFICRKESISCRDEFSEDETSRYDQISEPDDNGWEHVFFIENQMDADGWCTCAVINDKLELGVDISYKKETLPVLIEWKSMRSGDYVLGIEPSNSYIKGRKTEREDGELMSVKGFGSIEFNLRLGILDGKNEIAEFEKRCLSK